MTEVPDRALSAPPRYPRVMGERLVGDEAIVGGDPDMTVLDYWQWAHSGLNANIERGKLAEYLVAKAVGLASYDSTQDPWGDWDLVLPTGESIEVKCSSYIQDWDQSDYSKITFSGLKARELYYNEAVKPAASIGPADYKALIYVLSVQHHKEHASFSVRDLGQWTFYVLTRHEIASLTKNGKSVSIGTPVRGGVEGIPWSELGSAIADAVVRLSHRTIEDSKG